MLLHINLLRRELIEKALARGEAKCSASGVPVVYTGKYTGRSPKDRFIVDSAGVHGAVDWGEVNLSMPEANFERLYQKMRAHLQAQSEQFVYEGAVCADSAYRFRLRVVSETAYQSLFASLMFRALNEEERVNFIPDLTIYAAPDCLSDPARDGTRSEAFIVLHLEKKIVLVGGTQYCGEIKKSVFSMLNFWLPPQGVLPMHCAANLDAAGETALFFGLSGTGKTTLSADPQRRLIGDDEHGWSPSGIFNLEGGCYAKCIRLRQESEPQIWGAIREGALVENVALTPAGTLDFDDESITENTRVAYPLSYIPKIVEDSRGPHPRTVIFLTADAFGVLPPIAKLNIEGALYHFLSGYTAKLAGTECGIKEPSATFSACFGAPFMPRSPLVYAELLRACLERCQSAVYLVNTGWQGGPYGIGQRLSIQDTRAMVAAALQGQLQEVKTRCDALFKLEVPVAVPGVRPELLEPRKIWRDPSAYESSAQRLAALFAENFARKFSGAPAAVAASGPCL